MSPGVNGFNAYVKVKEVTTSAITRADGSTTTLAEGTAGDDTGFIRFRVIGDSASVLKTGGVVAWRNGISEVF